MPGAGLLVAALVMAGVVAAPPTAGAGDPTVPVDDRPAAAVSLARIEIEVRGRIPDEEKKQARMLVRNDGRTVYRGSIGIETRGQSSLRFPKKSWSLELRDRRGENRDVSLLGMPADDDWVLSAPYSDKTLMRNVLAYETARSLGSYAARTRFVEVRLNGRYRGVYVLTERLKLHEDRIDLPEPAQLLEWTTPRQALRKGKAFRLPGAGVPVLFDDPERDDLTRAARRAVKSSIIAADLSLYEPTWRDPATGWRTHLDEASVVEYIVLNELFKNHDGFLASTYLSRGAGQRWMLGPIWDFDVSMGNFGSGPAGVVDGSMLAGQAWAQRLYADPAFVGAVAERWRSLRAAGLRERLLARVTETADRLRATKAVKRNFERWPVLGEVIGPNPPEAADRTTYASEVAALSAWLDARISWMDAHVHELAPRS